MALGIIASGVEDPLDLSSALLRDHITNQHPWFVRLGAMLGLGFAYASSKKEVVTGKDGIVESLRQVSCSISGACGLIQLYPPLFRSSRLTENGSRRRRTQHCH